MAAASKPHIGQPITVRMTSRSYLKTAGTRKHLFRSNSMNLVPIETQNQIFASQKSKPRVENNNPEYSNEANKIPVRISARASQVPISPQRINRQNNTTYRSTSTVQDHNNKNNRPILPRIRVSRVHVG